MKDKMLKTLASSFDKLYGEYVAPDEVLSKLFYTIEEREECAEWLKDNVGFCDARYIDPELIHSVQTKASKEYVAVALGGEAHIIVALQFPCMEVWCESLESGVTDPYNSDLPEYARIDYRNGEIHWQRHADLLSKEQKEKIIKSATKYKS